MSYLYSIKGRTGVSYDIEDARIPHDAFSSEDAGKILSVDENGKIKSIEQKPDSMILDVSNSKITQSGADVTNETKLVLGLDKKADLVDGKVPSSQLPSYVDSVISGYYFEDNFYKDVEHTELITPEANKIYIDKISNKTYRWTGSTESPRYAEISSSLALGETSTTAYRGDRGKIAFDHSNTRGNLAYSVVSEYRTTATYNVDDVVKFNNKEYNCISAVTVPGSFDPTKWELINPHNLTHRDIGAVTSVNGVTPNKISGDVELVKVPYADNLYSVDNQEDLGQFVFRTAGGNASISTGSANLGYVEGSTDVTELTVRDRHHKQKINTAYPTDFKSTLFNAFNQYDPTMVFPNTGLNEQGAFIYNAGTYAAIVHVVGGVVAGNGNVGYTCAWLQSENVPIPGINNVLKAAAFSVTKPNAQSTGLTLFNINSQNQMKWIDDDYGKRLNIFLTDPTSESNAYLPNGYLVLICSDVEHLYVHPRWSGYMDGSLAEYSVDGVIKTYKESVITLPTMSATEEILPYTLHGLCSLTLSTGTVIKDKIDLVSFKYTQKVGYYENDAAGHNLSIVRALTDEYIYDNDIILYNLTDPLIYDLNTSISNEYLVDDFGTEEYLYKTNKPEVSLTGDCWYGLNLKDKLRVDTVTISNQSLTKSQQKQVRTNIGAIGDDVLGVKNGIATLDSKGIVYETQLPNYVKSINGISPETTGNVFLNEVPLADNLVSPDNDTDTSKYINRTSGGTVSLSDGEAQLLTLSGVSANPDKTVESFNITFTNYDDGGTPCSAVITPAVWRNNDLVGWYSGTYVFDYVGGIWKVTSEEAGLSGVEISLASCGMYVTGVPAESDKFIVTYSRTNSAVQNVSTSRVVTSDILSTSTFLRVAKEKGFGDVTENSIEFVYDLTSGKWTGKQAQSEYSEFKTYAVGDIVKYRADTTASFDIYKCIQAVETPEVWDPTKWNKTHEGTDIIVISGLDLVNDFTMIFSSNLFGGDKVIVSMTYNTETEVYNATINVIPRCFLILAPQDLTKWFARTSLVRNMLGPNGTAAPFIFQWTSDSNWSIDIDDTGTGTLVHHIYTPSELAATFGLSYSIDAENPGITSPYVGDAIAVTPNITISESNEFVDFIKPNQCTVSFGNTPAQQAANKAKWRNKIDSLGSGTYKFTLNLAEVNYTLTKEGVEEPITTTAVIGDYGLQLDGTIGRKDYITVVYVKEVLGTYINSNPRKFQSIGLNSFNPNNCKNGFAISNGKIVADHGTPSVKSDSSNVRKLDFEITCSNPASVASMSDWTLFRDNGYVNPKSPEGTYLLTYTDGSWKYNDQFTELRSDWGIRFSGSVAEGDTISIVCIWSTSTEKQYILNNDVAAAKLYDAGTYVFIFNVGESQSPVNGKWTLNQKEVTLSDYGITMKGTALPENGEIITIEIQTDSYNYICWIRACYANEQGWTIYSPGKHIRGLLWAENFNEASPTSTDTQVKQTRSDAGGITYDSAGRFKTDDLQSLSNFYFEDTGKPSYIIVHLNILADETNDLCVHPRWSGYRNLTDGYITDAEVAEWNEEHDDNLVYGTTYADHVSTIVIPTRGNNRTTGSDEDLPLATYGMPRVGYTADELHVDIKTYTKRIGRQPYSTVAEREQIISSLTTEYMYDSSYVYYILETPVVYDVQITNDYIVCDFGVEDYTNTEVVCESTSLYGKNLRDKLRTNVLTISAQDLTTSQQTQVLENLFDSLNENQKTLMINYLFDSLTGDQKESVRVKLSAYSRAEVNSKVSSSVVDNVYTLSADGWVEGSYELEVPGLTATDKIIVGMNPASSKEQRIATSKAQLSCVAQTNNQIVLVCDGILPLIDLSIVIRKEAVV